MNQFLHIQAITDINSNSMLQLHDFYLLFIVIAVLIIALIILRRIHARRRKDLQNRFRKKE